MRTAEPIADIPVPGGERDDLIPDPDPTALPVDLPGVPIQGVFFF